MRYHVLVTDYDGTLAQDGRVSAGTISALERLRASGRHVVLVSGRVLPDLQRVFDRFDLFDLAVLENGGLLFDPATGDEQVLTESPPDAFIRELERRNVTPLDVGRGIVATWEPNEKVVLEVIRELGLELEIIFNKGAVMVLPSGVNKATGMAAALSKLGLSAHNAVAIGDAQNDHAFLAVCEASVAVANALPTLKDRADLVTRADHGDGVAELIDGLIADDLVALEPRLGRHELRIGESLDRAPVTVPPFARNLLLVGPSGAGKSSLTTAFLEALREHGYQFCLIDPEGDHGSFPDAVTLGRSDRPPTVDEAIEVLQDPSRNLVVDLLGIPLSERPEFFETVLPRLNEMRVRFGRPHWIIVDEAHHLLPANWQAPPDPFSREIGSTMLVGLEPGRLNRAALRDMSDVVAVGDDPWRVISEFVAAGGPGEPPDGGRVEEAAPAALWHPGEDAVTSFTPREPTTERQRHRRKYAEGDLGPERSFYFRGPDGRLNLQAQNLDIFVQLADGVDDETWLHHLRAGDYSHWMRDHIKDDDLAEAVQSVETKADELGPAESRDRVREAIEERYTAAV